MNLLPAGHEEGAIYEGNQRIPNGRRIAGAAMLRSNPQYYQSSGANLNIIRACTKRHMNLLPAGHEEGAIYEGNADRL